MGFFSKNFYELGENISKNDARRANFFKVKNEKSLGVKIFYTEAGSFEGLKQNDLISSNFNAVRGFEKELEIGQHLNSLKVSTPKYIGIFDIKISNNLILPGLVMEIIDDVELYKIDFLEENLILNNNKITMEEITMRTPIENGKEDLIISKICETFNILFEKTNYTKLLLIDSDPQGLFSFKNDTFYLIDFGQWPKLIKKERKNCFEKKR